MVVFRASASATTIATASPRAPIPKPRQQPLKIACRRQSHPRQRTPAAFSFVAVLSVIATGEAKAFSLPKEDIISSLTKVPLKNQLFFSLFRSTTKFTYRNPHSTNLPNPILGMINLLGMENGNRNFRVRIRHFHDRVKFKHALYTSLLNCSKLILRRRMRLVRLGMLLPIFGASRLTCSRR